MLVNEEETITTLASVSTNDKFYNKLITRHKEIVDGPNDRVYYYDRLF